MRWMLLEIVASLIIGAGGLQNVPPVTIDDTREPTRLEQLWPADVEMPEGLQEYQPFMYSQRLVENNNLPLNHWQHIHRDFPFANGPAERNPNLREWAAPGGLQGLTGWQSIKAAYVPTQPYVFTTMVRPPNAGISIRKTGWQFPAGTVFAELLLHDGKVFELRTARKQAEGWLRRIEHQDMSHAPVGYKGPGKACASCHDRAGASEQYGITVRGDDGVFSWAPDYYRLPSQPTFKNVGQRVTNADDCPT